MAQWTLTDNSTGTPVVLTFVLNPFQFEPPGREANIKTESTTAPNGQPILFQGYDKIRTTSFRGRVITEAFYNSLNTWKDKSYPMVLTDDQGNSWTVLIKTWKWTRLKRRNRWAFDYDAEVYVL